MTQDSTHRNRVERTATLRWVPIRLMRVSPLAQRELNQARVDKIVANLDLEQVGAPTVNKRGGHFYIIDGQHRIEALRADGWEDQQIQCWQYEELTEAEEAEKFLKLNDVLAVAALPKFRVSVQAGREMECDIDRIVRSNGCKVSSDKSGGGISAVATLIRIYTRTDGKTLGRAIRIIRDAYGTPGLEADVLDGIGYLCGRYNGDLEDQVAVAKLAKVQGGVNGLRGRAEVIRQRTGLTRGHAVAAAAVDIINSGARGGAKLANWFREDAA